MVSKWCLPASSFSSLIYKTETPVVPLLFSFAHVEPLHLCSREKGKRDGWWSVPGEIYAQGIMASSRCYQDSTTITSKIILGNHATAYPSLTNHAPFTLLLRFHILLNPYLCLSPALQNASTWRTFSQGTRNTCFQSSPSTGILVMEWILKSLKTHRFTKHLNPGLFVFLIVLSLFLQGFSLIGFLDFESIS